MTVTVSAKGQLVIPASIRKRHRLAAGARVQVLDLGREIVVVPVPDDAFKASRGMLKGSGFTVKEFLRWRRAERRREHARLRSV
jgi:AbrB family looped-hinge helix DNA binding protein